MKAALRFLGILLVAEGLLMALCLIPAVHFADGTALLVAVASAFTAAVGGLLWLSFARHRAVDDRRMAYLFVVLVWLVLTLFASLPLLPWAHRPARAWFEAMSGITSCGATVFPEVEALPASILLWRSMTQWFGGFGIVLLVLAITPRLGINRFALYSAESSAADYAATPTVRTSLTVRRTLGVYLSLTVVFIALLRLSGMHLWDAVNLTLTNISSGGFAVSSTSIAGLTPLQQWILAGAMLLSGVNFSLLYLFFTLHWRRIGHKLEQFRFYILSTLSAAAFVVVVLHARGGLAWSEALRLGTVQTVSAVTTTGSVCVDTTLWPVPAVFLLLVLSLCGGMAGSTTGGLKAMRVIILWRNVRGILASRLHPRAVLPVRLNRQPVGSHLRANVMVIFLVFVVTLVAGVLLLMLCGVDATQSIGAAVGCLSGYGPGLGASGGFGSYTAFPASALWLCSLLMLLGRLECLTVLVLLLPRFWRR